MSIHVPGFSHFLVFLHHFVLAKLGVRGNPFMPILAKSPEYYNKGDFIKYLHEKCRFIRIRFFLKLYVNKS